MGFLESFLTLWDARGCFRRPLGRSWTTGEGSNNTLVMVWRLGKGSNTTLVMVLVLLGLATTPSNPLSDRRRRALRSINF